MSLTVKCLECGRVSGRKHPNQQFCGKNEAGRHVCKDRYHNKARFIAGNLSDARRDFIGMGHNGLVDDTHPFDGSNFNNE